MMKRFVALLLFILGLVPHIYTNGTTSDSPALGQLVYICGTGKVYHSTKECRGLSNATHTIKAVSLNEVQKKRRDCKICC
jgi:hypothetical protein